jgi:FlaG/FlaF family flagellin (archaellin)
VTKLSQNFSSTPPTKVKIFPHHLQVGARRASMQLIQPHPRTMKKTLLAILGLAAVSLAGVNGQVVITSSSNFTYSQNFNTLPTTGTTNTWTDNSTIPAWYSSRTVLLAGPGSSATAGLWSYGSSNSTDRALGFLSSGSLGGNFSVVFLNNSGSAISFSDIKLSFTGEQWRGNSNNSTLVFGYRTSSTPINDSTSGVYTINSNFNFTSPVGGITGGTVDGSLSQNQQSFTNLSLDSTGSLSSGDYLALRWDRGTQTNGAGLGIDNFQLDVVPEPSTWALIGMGSAFVLWRIRRRSIAG